MIKITLASLVLTSVASAQATFPAGEVYGYSIATEATSSRTSFVSTDSAFQFNAVPVGATSLSLSDSISAEINGSHEQFNIETGCVSRWDAGIGDPGVAPSSTPGTHSFEMTADASSIRFVAMSESRHIHKFTDPCQQAATSPSTTRETGPNGGLVVPFELAQATTMRVQDVSRFAAWIDTVETGSGSYTTSQSGVLSVQLYSKIGGVWMPGPTITDGQFLNPIDSTLPAGTYAISITYTQDEELVSVSGGSGHTVASTAVDQLSVEILFL